MASVLPMAVLVVTMLILEVVISSPVGDTARRPCNCYAHGDPHYKSCDNMRYNFQGKCDYLFSELCAVDSDLVYYKVTEKNEECGRSTPQRQLTCVKEATLTVHSYTVEMFKDGSFRVDGEEEVDSWENPEYEQNQHLRVYRSGRRVFVKTNFGLRLTFANRRLHLRIPYDYATKVCGLCGNFNGDRDDDFISKGVDHAAKYIFPAGKNKAAHDFGNSLLIADAESSDDQCKGECLPSGEEDPCDGKDMENAQKACAPLKDASGPFGSCVNGNAANEDFKELYKDCLFDMCRNTDSCTVYKNFDDVCRGLQFESPTWRDVLKCKLDCKSHGTYAYSVSPCPNTCRNRDAEANCDRELEKVEGCVCKEGYLMEDGECVKEDKCGCRSSCGRYMKRDVTLLTRNCKYERQCKGKGEICEKPFDCKGDCFKADGKWQCDKKGNDKN